VGAAAATLAFASQDGVTAVTSDEVSYLALARLFVSGEPWARHLTTFPPLFPLVLAATGSAYDIARAHLVVAAFAIMAIPLVHRFAFVVLRGRAAAASAMAAFLITPATWLGAKQILAEPAFLVATLAALVFVDAQRGEASARDRWTLAILLAVAVLLRTAGLALVLAYAAHLALHRVSARGELRARDAIPIAVPVLAAVAWWIARPLEGRDIYALNTAAYTNRWIDAPLATLAEAVRVMWNGWVSAFALDSTAPAIFLALLAVLAAFALAGTWLRMRANRLDGWYVAVALAMLMPVFFGEQTARRYLYPLLPVLLVHAGVALAAAAARIKRRPRDMVIGLAWALMMIAPATSLVTLGARSLDDRTVLEGFPIRWSDMIDYYTARDESGARRMAAANAGVLAGFEAIARATPPQARVMWMRPEYVAVLARRPAAPWYYADDKARLARAIEALGVDYVALSGITKSDLAARQGDQAAVQRALEGLAAPVVEIPNAANGQPEFVLLKVDRDAVRAYLESRA
jgi:hypothetical protein